MLQENTIKMIEDIQDCKYHDGINRTNKTYAYAI